MKYWKVKWLHDNDYDPNEIWIEIDETKMEKRKVHIYGSGTYGYAYERIEVNGAFLAYLPHPELSIINEDPQFEGREISAQQFEDKWESIVSK